VSLCCLGLVMLAMLGAAGRASSPRPRWCLTPPSGRFNPALLPLASTSPREGGAVRPAWCEGTHVAIFNFGGIGTARRPAENEAHNERPAECSVCQSRPLDDRFGFFFAGVSPR
jgi:hypothetical protein